MTKTIPSDIRKAAKRMARAGGTTHQAALDAISRQHGHAGWGALLTSHRHTPADPLSDIIREAWAAGATSVRIDAGDHGVDASLRVHGIDRPLRSIERQTYDALRSSVDDRVSLSSDGALSEGEMQYWADGRAVPVRLVTMHWGDTSRIVLHLPDQHVERLTLEQLGIGDLSTWLKVCRSGPGLVIVSGTTGSGKSVTISRTVERLTREGIDIVAFEDDLTDAHFLEDIVRAAATRTVMLETYARSLDRAIAQLLGRGLGNGALARIFIGGIHQDLILSLTGPRRMSSVVLPWRG